MNISFIIPDDKGVELQAIAEAKFPDALKAKAINKLLKDYIAELIDKKNKDDIIGADEQSLKTIAEQIRVLVSEQQLINSQLMRKRIEVIPLLVPTNLGAD